MAPQLLLQLNVAERHDMSPMQLSQASAALVRQRLSHPETS